MIGQSNHGLPLNGEWWPSNLIMICLWTVIETVFSFVFKKIDYICACIVTRTNLEEIFYIQKELAPRQ